MAYATDHGNVEFQAEAKMFAPYSGVVEVGRALKRMLEAGLRWGGRREVDAIAFGFDCPGDRVKLTDAMERELIDRMIASDKDVRG